MPQPTSTPRWARPLLAGATAALLATSPTLAQPADPAPADPEAPEVEFTLDHFVFIPPTTNILYDSDDDLPNDPTIIPFSNWLFYGPDGEWQPWRKRTHVYTRNAGGQQQAFDPAYPVLRFYWSSPADIGLEVHNYTPTDEPSEVLRYGGWSTNEGAATGLHYRYCKIEDVGEIPETYNLRLNYTLGDWETVVAAGLNAQFPVGDEHCTILYMGAPLPNSRAAQTAREFATDAEFGGSFRNDFTFEIHTQQNDQDSGWRYRLQCYDHNDERRSIHGFRVGGNQDSQQLARIPLDEIDRVEIQRKKIHTLTLDPIDLSPLDNLGPGDLTQERIEVTPRHVFGETNVVRLGLDGDGAEPLLDLDAIRTHAPAQTDASAEGLARHLEEHEIDLMLVRKGDGMRLQMCANPAYYLADAEYWDRSPAACLQRLGQVTDDDYYLGYAEFILPAEVGDDLVFLTTTSDGTMALFRVVADAPDDAHVPGQVTLEVRRLVGP